MRRLGLPGAVLATIAACGARSEIRDSNLEPLDAAVDSSPQPDVAPLPDVVTPPDDVVAPPDVIENDGAVCCEDGQNLNFPPDDLSSGASVAWQYIPQCNITVIGIELHNLGGEVVIRDSNGAEPGDALWTGTLPPTGNTLDWTSATVSPPLPLAMGHVYWIQEAPGPLSEASDGVEYTYYADTSNGWNGPWNWHPYTSRVHGECH